MSKEKYPFEKTAAALKIMGKKISAKKGTGSNILKCVFVPNRIAHAIATDGHVAAVLDLNQYEDFSKIEVLQELRRYYRVVPHVLYQRQCRENRGAGTARLRRRFRKR